MFFRFLIDNLKTASFHFLIDKSENLKKSKGVTLLIFFKGHENHVLMKFYCWYLTFFL